MDTTDAVADRRQFDLSTFRILDINLRLEPELSGKAIALILNFGGMPRPALKLRRRRRVRSLQCRWVLSHPAGIIDSIRPDGNGSRAGLRRRWIFEYTMLAGDGDEDGQFKLPRLLLNSFGLVG